MEFFVCYCCKGFREIYSNVSWILIAKNYRQGETKVRYNIQFGIARILKIYLWRIFQVALSVSNLMKQLHIKFRSNKMYMYNIGPKTMIVLWIHTVGLCLLVTIPMKTLQNILNILVRTWNGIPHTYCN